jgi:23S rRNA (adenine2503-C2)-methyltransferase
MGCAFCASTIGGKVRDLTSAEMLGQIIVAQNDTGERISNVVMMGIGEPLDNYQNVIRFLKLVNCEDGLNIGYRHISLSTCGLADKIDELAKENFPITLSISLHASDDVTRSSIMPVNKKWNIERLMSACKNYYRATGRRISFEYTLISGKNDSRESALALAELLNKHLRSRTDTMPIHVNLIPVNPVTETEFSSSEKKTVEEFAATLEKKGVRATVRRRLGADINASCGQLRREEETKN